MDGLLMRSLEVPELPVTKPRCCTPVALHGWVEGRAVATPLELDAGEIVLPRACLFQD